MKYRFRRRLLYTLLLFLDSLFLLIPYSLALRIGRSFGILCYILLGKNRRITKKHLRFAFADEKSENEISDIARSVFINLGMSFAEILSLPKIKGRLNKIIGVKGLEKFDDVLKKGKGVIAITAHLGNWELIPMYFASMGYAANVVARRVYYEKYDEWTSYLRSNMGVNVIYRSDSPKRLLNLLKNNELVGIVPDQDVDSIDGIFVDFFGKKTYTPSAPVKLAIAADTTIIPLFIVRDNGKHTIYVDEPFMVERDSDKESAVLKYTQKWSDIVESYIRKYPGQWVWMHRRWKTRPGS
ncbi:MAG: hypothetical protein ABH843_04250 [Candidatus Omnitrophota bacterium]